MLDLAIHHINELQVTFSQLITKEQYKFCIFEPFTKYFLEIDSQDLNKIQYVGIDEKTKSIVGYVEARVNRLHNFIEQLIVLTFKTSNNILKGKDFFTFLDILLNKYRFRKIIFSSISDNPATKMYFKYLVNKYKIATHCGHYKNHYYLRDGKIHDLDVFEIVPEDFNKFYKKRFFGILAGKPIPEN
jgi:hypothetical protein